MSPHYNFPGTIPKRLGRRLFDGRKPAERLAVIVGLSLALLFLLLLLLGLIPRLVRQMEMNRRLAELGHAVPKVYVVSARRTSNQSTTQLPGDVQAWEEATIYARTDGFLKIWMVDRGDHVKEGQQLAVIDSPEVDQQLAQARHELDQSKKTLYKDRANLDYAKLTKKRWVYLMNEGAVSHEDADTNINLYKEAVHQAEADEQLVKSNDANVKRLLALQSFEQVTAPFDGIITDRRVNTGDLITSGSTTATTNLYKIARIHVVRVFIEVPQRYVSSVQVGQEARVYIQEFPGQVFIGHVARTANELDPTARTLLTEVDVPNPDGKLLPGMYSQVTFTTKLDYSPVIIPANTLVLRSNGTQVAIVTAQNLIHWQPIELGRDYGNEVEVLSGLSGNEQLVVNPTDKETEGRQVQPLPASQQ